MNTKNHKIIKVCHVAFESKPSPELENAVSKMIDIAKEKLDSTIETPMKNKLTKAEFSRQVEKSRIKSLSESKNKPYDLNSTDGFCDRNRKRKR